MAGASSAAERDPKQLQRHPLIRIFFAKSWNNIFAHSPLRRLGHPQRLAALPAPDAAATRTVFPAGDAGPIRAGPESLSTFSRRRMSPRLCQAPLNVTRHRKGHRSLAQYVSRHDLRCDRPLDVPGLLELLLAAAHRRLRAVPSPSLQGKTPCHARSCLPKCPVYISATGSTRLRSLFAEALLVERGGRPLRGLFCRQRTPPGVTRPLLRSTCSCQKGQNASRPAALDRPLSPSCHAPVHSQSQAFRLSSFNQIK